MFFSYNAHSALSLDATRYIFNENSSSVSVMIKNDSQSEYAAQIWIDNSSPDKQPKFIVTPSFFRIKAGSTQVVRIIKAVKDISQDDEKLFWLNLQEIPPKLAGNGLNMAIRTQVKVIYRPELIREYRYASEKKLTVSHESGKTYLRNTTPYIFAIGNLYSLNGIVELSKSNIASLSIFKPGDYIKIDGEVEVTALDAINDYGNVERYILNVEDESEQ
nr:fimbria/pilus periplasmic chaperone [Shewanella gaetbuli]